LENRPVEQKLKVVDDEMLVQIVGEYMLYRDDQPTAEALHTVSCRLLLDIMPGLETSVIFQDNVLPVLFVMFRHNITVTTVVNSR